MEIFLAAVGIGLVITVSVTFIMDDLRFVPRHILCAVMMALGFGVTMPIDRNSDTQNVIGLMVMGGSIWLWVRGDKRHSEQKQELEPVSVVTSDET